MAVKLSMIELAVTGVSGTDTTTRPIRGTIKSVYVVYQSGSNANTDVTITMLGTDITDGADQTLFNKDNSNTSTWYYPQTYAQDTTGTDLTFDGTRKVPTPFLVYGRLKLTTAQNNAGKTVTAYIFVEE